MSDFKVERDWITDAGLRAVVVMASMGHRCGYVGVPAGHPLHGVAYGDRCEALGALPDDTVIGKRSILSVLCVAADPSRLESPSPELFFDVHGGLTYSGGNDYPVISKGLWWFGYDCAHHGDAKSPEAQEEMRQRYPDKPFMWHDEGVHRTLAYCVAECESLAHQIARATGADHDAR